MGVQQGEQMYSQQGQGVGQRLYHDRPDFQEQLRIARNKSTAKIRFVVVFLFLHRHSTNDGPVDFIDIVTDPT